MQYQTLQVEQRGHMTHLTLNRPEVMNAINQVMHDELEHAFNAFAAAGDQYLCVIRGVGGRAFCAGSDLKSIAARGEPHVYPAHGYAGLIERFDLDKPVLAAVDGVAVGGGFELALACDLIIATDRSRFGLPEPLVGAVALGGGMHRLARQIGLKQAMGLILTGDLVGASEGHRLGFVNTVVAAEAFEQEIERWCTRILRCAPLATRASKQSVMRGLSEPDVQAAMVAQQHYPAFADCYESEDRLEGARAFAEKRPPSWTGR